MVTKKPVGEPDLVPRQGPGDLVEDVGFVALQVGERDAVQQVVDASLQHSPHRPDATRRLRATSMRVDRMQITVDLERDVLGCLHDILDGDGLGITRQVVAALRAAHRVHQASASQAEEDLLDVVVGETFLLGELARRHRPLPRALGEVQGNDQTIFGPGGNAHTHIKYARLANGIQWPKVRRDKRIGRREYAKTQLGSRVLGASPWPSLASWHLGVSLFACLSSPLAIESRASLAYLMCVCALPPGPN